MIRKFLDAQRIHNLTAYLQTLHRQSLANADHTTLLLNCYTKLKDSSKLEEFIKVQGGGGGCRFPEGPTEREVALPGFAPFSADAGRRKGSPYLGTRTLWSINWEEE